MWLERLAVNANVNSYYFMLIIQCMSDMKSKHTALLPTPLLHTDIVNRQDFDRNTYKEQIKLDVNSQKN